MSAPPLCILMATCNGARFLREQVASIQAQTRQDWVLLARDDGSGDGTRDILRELARQEPRMTLVGGDGGAGLGPAGNFGALMARALCSDSRIFFFSDQDDVWLPDKLERQAAAFPGEGGESGPLLVHSDLRVVGESLAPIAPSFMAHMALDPRPADPLGYLLTRNFVTGCASAANRSLVERALPIPPDAIMHDWWLALLAAAGGDIDYIDEALVLYRQHGSNTIGAKSFWHGLNPTRNWWAGWRAGNREFRATLTQAEALLSHGDGRNPLPKAALESAAAYAEILDLGKRDRLARAKRLGLRQGNRLLQLILYARLMTLDHR